MAAKAKNNNSAANLGFEAKLWLTGDKLRNNMDDEHKTETRQPTA